MDGRTGANNVGCSALFIASRAGHTAVVELLLALGASCWTDEEVMELSDGVDMRLVDGSPPLLIACQEGHIPVVELLLASGASVDLSGETGATSLNMASMEGHTAVVELLLASGASVDRADARGLSSLFIACQLGHLPVVELLLAARASVDKPVDNGATSLYVACQNNHIALVDLLLAAGANVDVTIINGDAVGSTPLLTASQRGQTAVVMRLLAAGASQDIALGTITPIKIAKQQKHTAVVELLDVWPALSTSRLMVATAMRQESTVRALLNSGEDPNVTVQHQQHTLSALILATMDEATSCWAAPVCPKTFRLIKQSLQWSPHKEVHQLFPPAFRRGVRHILGLMLALESVKHKLTQDEWMRIIACLPRDWGLTEPTDRK